MEDPGSGEMNHEYQQDGGQDMGIRGYLSVRMQCEGNLWQELWASAKPVPAIKQAPLFDEELAGESTLDALENLAPSDLFEQLFTAALSAGFAIAEAAPAAKRDHVATCLKECRDYIVTTCTRGMSTSKLEHLCEVYEVMETVVNAPPPEEPVEAEVMSTNVSIPFEANVGVFPEPIAMTEFDSPLSRKSYNNQQATQLLKGENVGNLLSRIFEVKASLFEKKQMRSFTVDDKRRPSPTVSGEWTFV
jgi:Rab3 GTPase-activating protein catalytic subunit